MEMLILAPSSRDERDGDSINDRITQRLDLLRGGHIEALFHEAMSVSSWSSRSHSNRPNRPGNRAAQDAADNDNYSAAIARASTASTSRCPIGPATFPTVQSLYTTPYDEIELPIPPPPPLQPIHLPGNIAQSIRKSKKGTGPGFLSDSLDLLRDLASLRIPQVDSDLHYIFDLVFRNCIPPQIHQYFQDTYLFMLYKDPDDPSKLRPISIPTAMRRLLGNHITKEYNSKFAMHLCPKQWAIGIPGGADFIVKTVQLGIDTFIQQPQQSVPPQLPTRAAVFFDFKNMFNLISQSVLMNALERHFPELIPIATLLYGSSSNIHFQWEDGSWRLMTMEEGSHQGCPLSSLFAALVLEEILAPLESLLKDRAHERLLKGDPGDDGYGSITHFFSFVDDNTTLVPLQDLLFCCDHMKKLAHPRGGYVNTNKTRILTSCNGHSILPSLSRTNASLAIQVKTAIANYSNKPNPIPHQPPIPVEITDGYRLLGIPVGSPSFARQFLIQRANDIRADIQSLHQTFPDLHTRLRLLTQCIIPRFSHLLGAEVMHSIPLSYDFMNWEEWDGYFTRTINNIQKDILSELADVDNIPDYSLYIAQIGINDGGLGFLRAGSRGPIDFAVTMAKSTHYATNGIRISPDVAPIILHPTISDLYSQAIYPTSPYLQRFHKLLPHIASVATSTKCPPSEEINHFLYHTSAHSARGRLKHHCSSGLTQVLYNTIPREHLHHLPSILSPQTSYPLVHMCRSKPSHRLNNNIFIIALRRKLRLPITDPTNPPTCKCGEIHDCWGDHAFHCVSNNKKMAHNIIRDTLAATLPPILSTAGYILPTTLPLETEKPNVIDSDTNLFPLDVSFDIDPSPSTATSAAFVPYSTIGGDVTITPPVQAPRLSASVDLYEKVTAVAERNLQTKERLKLVRDGSGDPMTENSISGEDIIKQMIDKGIILIPMTIDPHGKWGPMLENFLFGYTPLTDPLFEPTQACPRRRFTPHAKTMYELAMSPPCPTNIVTTACIYWQQNKTRTFFGRSYTAPTPKEYLIGELGLGITKALSLHLRNSQRKLDQQPPSSNNSNSPPGLTHPSISGQFAEASM